MQHFRPLSRTGQARAGLSSNIFKVLLNLQNIYLLEVCALICGSHHHKGPNYKITARQGLRRVSRPVKGKWSFLYTLNIYRVKRTTDLTAGAFRLSSALKLSTTVSTTSLVCSIQHTSSSQIDHPLLPDLVIISPSTISSSHRSPQTHKPPHPSPSNHPQQCIPPSPPSSSSSSHSPSPPTSSMLPQCPKHQALHHSQTGPLHHQN